MLVKLISIRAVIIALSILTFTACRKEQAPLAPVPNTTDESVAGYIYTSTNGEGTNQIVRFTRHDDGTLSNESAYSTESDGGADVTMGGDAHGDFDSQGAVQIIGNYLLTVNAGGNDVSVFSLDRTNGNLSYMTKVPSGGMRPTSIAYTKKSGSMDEYWVVVGNQWNNPNVQKDGDSIERYPDNMFHEQDLTLPDATDGQRNIQLFSFNAMSGSLTSVSLLDTYVRKNGGPTSVSFSDDGSKLAVTTWGISHFATMMTSLDEQHPSRVYIYDFANGAVSNERYFEEEGIAGSIGFHWAKENNSKLYVSNFNLIPSKLDNSLTVLWDDGSSVTKAEHLSVTSPNGINEACWTALNSAGNVLYVTSFATNLVSTFDLSGTNARFFSSELRGGIHEPGDSKELFITPDNKYLYNVGAFNSYSINRFDIMGSGIMYNSQTILETTANGAGMPGKYNFMGLTGFDL